MLAVNTKSGCPLSLHSLILSIIALSFSFIVLKIISFQSFLIIFLFVGMLITFKLYISKNSSDSVTAVPVQPDILLYSLK